MNHDHNSKPLTTEQAAASLARLVNRELNIELKPEEVVRVLLARWNTIGMLAHIIHRNATEVKNERQP